MICSEAVVYMDIEPFSDATEDDEIQVIIKFDLKY
jgi:hypothetical protein